MDSTSLISLNDLLLTSAAYRQSAILASGIELKVFSLLSGRPAPLFEAAQRIEIPERSAERLLGGLIAIDLIRKEGSLYRNTETAEQYLVQGKDLYLGDGILFLKSLGERTWSTLTESLKKGVPVGDQRTGAPDAEFWRKLTVAIRPYSKPIAEHICQLLHRAGMQDPSVLDLAGGSGVFGQTFLKNFPGARSLQVDWPTINGSARKFAEEMGVGERFRTLDEDVMSGSWGREKFDVAILSHFLHQESKENSIALLKKIRSSMTEGGIVLINEYCVNTEKTGSKYGLIFALSMAIQNHGGDAYSIAEYSEWLAETGFAVELVYSPLPPATLLVARAVSNSQTVSLSSIPPMKDTSKTVSRSDVQGDLLIRMKKQLDFAVQNVDFWRKRIPIDLLKSSPFCVEELERIPLLTKAQIRNASPFDLLPPLSTTSSDFVPVCYRGTGGTTGKPTGVFWTQKEWDAAIDTSVQYLDALKTLRPLVAWNGYNQAHVSGPAFDDIVRRLGGVPIPRHFKSTDLQASEEISRLKANLIIITPKSGSGKGGSLEDLLIINPDVIRKSQIKAVLVSSTPLEQSMIEELRSQGVEHIYNFYGSTEGFPTGISCKLDPTSFHLCYGHLLTEIVDENGHHVKSGERGLVVVSRIALGSNPNHGTQLFRYIVGDSAEFVDEPCACGSPHPKIRGIQRVKEMEDKLKGGCERWE